MRKLYEIIEKNFFASRRVNSLKKEYPPLKHPLITISREMGSGGRLVAELVVKKLGNPWKLFHKEIVEEIAKTTHLHKEFIKAADENTLSLIDQIISDFFGNRYLTLNTYHRNLVKVLSVVGNRGFVVIIGRGAHNLFPNSLKVRIICEMEQRIKWEMEYEHVSEKEAIRKIEESDRKREEFEKSVFHHDPKKAHHYDLVIRTGKHLSIENAADLIVRMAKRRFKL